jgi:hypothetical protein
MSGTDRGLRIRHLRVRQLSFAPSKVRFVVGAKPARQETETLPPPNAKAPKGPDMNTRSTLTALALVFTTLGAAQAQEVTTFPPTASIASRADVAAEAARFVAAGKMHESSYLVLADGPVSTRDRAEVRAEAARAVATGEARLLNSDGWTPRPAPRVEVRQLAGLR